jgi:hypothetical protein
MLIVTPDTEVLKMEAIFSSKMLVLSYRATECQEVFSAVTSHILHTQALTKYTVRSASYSLFNVTNGHCWKSADAGY